MTRANEGRESLNIDRTLTIPEVAADLRCSKAHVYNIILGRVKGVLPIPVIALGRRKLVRSRTLEAWKEKNESALVRDMLPASPFVDAVRRVKGNGHA